MKYLQILADSTHHSDKNWGYLPYVFMAIGSIIWPLPWIFANEHNINFAEASMVRGFVCLLINYLMCRYYQSPTTLTDKVTHKFLNIRCVLIVMHGFGFAFSQYIIPLPIVHTINCSSTLFIFSIDYFLNGVVINSKQAIGITIGILGTILTTNGQLITKYLDPTYHIKTKFQNYITEDDLIRVLFGFIFLALVALWAFSVVITKKVKANTFQNNFVSGMWMFFSGSILYPFIESKCTISSLVIAAITFGLPLVISQWFFIASLTMTKNTGVLNMMTFISVFVSYLVSIFRYDQPLNLVTIFGIIMVFIGVYKSIFNRQIIK